MEYGKWKEGSEVMAQLPSEQWLIQQIGSEVILFERDTEAELVHFDPANGNECAQAQETIHKSELLSDEDKCFAHFWSGYFYAHASRWSLDM